MLGRREARAARPAASRASSTPTTARCVEAACDARRAARDPRSACANRFGEWRHLEAHVTDLRDDRHVRGVVLNARDVDRARPARGGAHPPGVPRRAHRPRQPRPVPRPARPGARAVGALAASSLAVLLVDLDGFKQVNDSLGHDAGDQLLQEVAERFAEVTRPGDTLARLGGDEFALLLEGANEARGRRASRARLLERLSEPVVDRRAASSRSARASASSLHAGGRGEQRGPVRHADVAMYAAKEAGRGRYEVFRHDMAREFGELLGLEHELRLALERGEFSVHYQPEVDLASRHDRRRRGAPALDTRRPAAQVPPAQLHPDRRGDRPDPAARRVRAARGLRADRALAQRRPAARAASPPGSTSPASSSRPGGFSTRSSATRSTATGLPAELLGLEVTETAIVVEGAAGDARAAELEELHELGVRIAIDDFGTGFSSLGQLRRFPVDMIKVDRSFVQGVEHDAKDAAITANLVSLAHAPRPAGDRRGHRVRRPARLGARARLRPGAGLPVRAADARGGRRRRARRGRHRPAGRLTGAGSSLAPTWASSQAFIGAHASHVLRAWASPCARVMPRAPGARRAPAISDLCRSRPARGWSRG